MQETRITKFAIWFGLGMSKQSLKQQTVRDATLADCLTSLDKQLDAQFDRLFEHAATARFYWYDQVRKNGLKSTNAVMRDDPGAIFLLNHATFIKLRFLEPMGLVHLMTEKLIRASELWIQTKAELHLLETSAASHLPFAMIRKSRARP